MTELITIIGLLAFISAREYLSFKERSEMTDRLMAKNLPEYKEQTHPQEEINTDPEESGLQDLEDARNELLGEDDPDDE